MLGEGRGPGVRLWLALAFLLLLLMGGARLAAEEEPAGQAPAEAEPEREAAEMRVRGFGFLGNRALMRTLEIVRDATADPTYFSASQIEDGAMILIARMQQEGYLQPRVTVRLELEDGSTQTHVWDETMLTQLPRPLRATRVRYRVEQGRLYYYDAIEFEGLTVLDEDEARDYFIVTGFLFQTRRARVFTPDGLDRGVSNLREVLVRQGYERARATVAQLDRDDASGAVRVRIRVQEGRQSLIRSVRVAVPAEETSQQEEVVAREPYSRVWTQDYAQTLRRDYYERGFPDAQVTVDVAGREVVENVVMVDLAFTVEPGPYVEVGSVEFRGEDRTRESVMRRRVGLRPGDPLNRIEVDQGRFRLARLGVFDWVDVELEEVDENTRNVIYNLREGREIDVNLLLGYGSYEMFRAGVEVEQFNLLGRAHRSRLLLVQSMKATSGNYRYTVPELFGEDIHGFSQLFALRREERDFDRLEYGGSVGLQTFFHRVDTDASIRYTYQLLESRALATVEEAGVERAVVAAIGLDLQRDRRDNPIYPERGNAISSHLEVASAAFGGEVDYQRVEFGASYHRPLGGGRYLHAGFHHGVIHTFGAVAEEVPFNRRFFQGGERTVRGYLQGQASPRDSAGEVVGAETYMLLNAEFEQALTQRWSAILFSDSIGFARSLTDYPFDETLFSVGVGIRYKTFIGPIRLEYGYNLNPRPRDPRGALHLSIGFPF
jgi:outer membrane protein insertion porin family